jgi:hypothetical protein
MRKTEIGSSLGNFRGNFAFAQSVGARRARQQRVSWKALCSLQKASDIGFMDILPFNRALTCNNARARL